MQTVKITEVQALVKYSTEVKGSWVAIELGGTAMLTNSEETLESATAELYNRLTQQIKPLYREKKSEGGDIRKQETQEQPSNAPDHSPGPATTQQHYCVEHNQEYKKRNGQYGEFWSHQIKGTRQWCNEK
jgi:hypothetical protein